MTRDDASERQVQAADPAASTWLSANAGSGKTRVLTDRVSRLLLGGVEPQRILCLTYTKAAASEMQNRLFRRLGGWAMLEDAVLRASLAELGIEGPVGADLLAQARRLFARAIETPGGLRIQTIHSFCAALLRRFPLEAGVSPQFTELDDRAGRRLREDIVEEMADGLAPGPVAEVARLFTGEDLSGLVEEIIRNRDAFAAPLTAGDARRLFGLEAGVTADTLLAEVFLGGESDWLAEVAAVLARGSVTDVRAAQNLARVALDAPDLDCLEGLEGVFLTGRGAKAPFTAKIGSFPTKDTRQALGRLLNRLEPLMQRVEAARPRRIALLAAERTAALHAFAAAFLPDYALRKLRRGWLDFDDLIGKAKALLTDPSVAQWVLFRLDGGIDHILVDEAQDTSPDQWRVIELLTQEFTAGRGARDVDRTIFVVGDKKQSIYSFQGADLATFDAMKAQFRTRLAEVRTHLADLTLDHSFRSSPAILELVDLTFGGAHGLGGAVMHLPFRDLPGRVDLWPPIPATADPEPAEWFSPVDLRSDRHHSAQLARRIADEIAALRAAGTQIPTDAGPRPMTAGDVLILVQRRSLLFSEIIRACKAAGLPIAGADRLQLGAEMAVKDLMALLSFLATPEDDLSLAAVLRSPLFGWTEAQLYAVAQGRSGYLWSALRARDDHAATREILHDLRNQADFLRPFDLLERALTRHDGRRRLLARLGAEAEDGIDELLSQALAYERAEVPSLTGFLGWIGADEIAVKRQVDSAGGRIRVMTVHGAKGLEAPVVILPETQDRTPPDGAAIVTLSGGAAVWRTPADESPAEVADTVAARRDRAAAESLRLLYVAMTRAKCWLIVAAAGKTDNPTAWHSIIAAGMAEAGAETLDDGRLRLSHGDWPAPVPGSVTTSAPQAVLPGWATRPAPAAARAEPLLAPSDLGGAKVLQGETDPGMEEAALQRGRDLHLLLEHLPVNPELQWDSVARALLPDPGIAAQRLAEARAVLTAPGLASVFAPDTLTEVAVTGDLGGRRVYGSIDRLIVAPDRVTAIDYKSNRLVPEDAAVVPEGILRQMGAYAAVLGQIYPGRVIDTAILWTGPARLMPLPREMVMAALRRAGFP